MEDWSRRRVLSAAGGALAGFGVAPALANVAASPRPAARDGSIAPAPMPKPDLGAATRALIGEVGLSGQVTCVLADASSGAVRFARAADAPLPPASVAKAITAAYAFDTLGPGHRFTTRVLATGPVRDGVLDGDLVLAGGGAPGLSSADLAALAAQMTAAGLREVRGAFHVWDGALPRIAEIDPAQPDHVGYNASVSGLNLNYNRVHFEWRRRGDAYDVTMQAPAGGFAPQVSHSGMQIAGRDAPIFAHRIDPETGRELWSVARWALGGDGGRWLPVRDSALYAADVFRTLMRSEGIPLPAPTRADAAPQGAVLASHVGQPLAEVARGMLRYSNNMTAEVLGLAATAARTGAPPERLAASGAAMSDWARDALGMRASRFVDHSGLGAASRTTTGDLCAALLRLGPDGALRRALRDYTLRDDAGRALPFTVQAKTGTLNFVSALAGHIRPAGGRPLVFAILTADLDRREAIPPGQEVDPPGSRAWTGRSRAMQFDLARLWARLA